MTTNPENYDYVIELLQAVRDEPYATTPEQHVERSERRYGWLHMAHELIALELIDDVRAEGDFFRRPHVEQG